MTRLSDAGHASGREGLGTRQVLVIRLVDVSLRSLIVLSVGLLCEVESLI
eukprot:m.297477 g.297477  ORF g.297477 m.297477 type:complete len:50 (+) comp40770_c0_seq25:1034-1183(+)